MPHTQSRNSAPPPPPARFEVDCWLCDRAEFTATPELPDDWVNISIEGKTQALCPDCADWLEKDR